MAGGTGALPTIARLREATDEAKQTEGDEATGAASSPSVFLLMTLGLSRRYGHNRYFLDDQARRSAKSRSAASFASPLLQSMESKNHLAISTKLILVI